MILQNLLTVYRWISVPSSIPHLQVYSVTQCFIFTIIVFMKWNNNMIHEAKKEQGRKKFWRWKRRRAVNDFFANWISNVLMPQTLRRVKFLRKFIFHATSWAKYATLYLEFDFYITHSKKLNSLCITKENSQ